MNCGDRRAIAGVELAATELVIVVQAWRGRSDTTIYVQVGRAARHGVSVCATVISVEVDVDLGDGASPTDLTLIVYPLPLSLPKCLLLRLNEF